MSACDAVLSLPYRKWLTGCSAAVIVALLCALPVQAAAPIEVRMHDGKVINGLNLPWQAPAAARMKFAVQGKYKSFPYNTTAQIDWLPQAKRYEASQEVVIPLLGKRRQSSVGAIDAHGLVPEIFMDRGRKEYSTTFDAKAGQIQFSRGSTPLPWANGVQDRLSVFFQLAGMVAASVQSYPAGTQITMQAVSTSRVAPWTFTVKAMEELRLDVGTIAVLKLEHRSDKSGEHSKSAIWLAPSLQYLPVRIHMVEEDGSDELNLQLSSHAAP